MRTLPREVELALEMGPARRESESFEAYKKRRLNLNNWLNRYLKYGMPIFFSRGVDNEGNYTGHNKIAYSEKRQIKKELRGNKSARQFKKDKHN